MKIIAFSNPSFKASRTRVGVQIIAQLLAERGHRVDYAGVPTHPLDFMSPSRRPSFYSSWLRRGDKVPHAVCPGLHEYFLRAPWSRSRRYWHFERQLGMYTALAPDWLSTSRYDVCIRDTAMSGLFAERVHAHASVLRLNDHPHGLTGHIHPLVVERLESDIRRGRFAEIWVASPPLQDYARELAGATPITHFPNGAPHRPHSFRAARHWESE